MDAYYDFHNHTPRFDLNSEDLSLNFANTLNWHASDHPVEELNTYIDLVAWAFEAGLLSVGKANRLATLGNEHPESARQTLIDAITLREAIYQIFTALALDQQVEISDLAILTKFWRMASQHMYLAFHDGTFVWEDAADTDDLYQMLWPVVQAAVELLQSDLRHRIGQCQDDRGCGFLFLDTSRNRSRRWCSMESCGNRAKANRHYSRVKK